MSLSFKFKILIGGIISAAFLIFLANSFNAFTPIQLPIICSFVGPENSPDLLRLTDFLVTGPQNQKVGDKIYISFKLQNYGQYDLNLGSKGVFVAAKDPQNSDVSFSFTRANTVFKTGETITVSTSKNLDKAGTWKFWPSYHLTFAGAPEKFGPNEWHACTIQVTQPVVDSDGDGITDEEDNCPNEAETFNNYQDEDGCPDTLPVKTLPDLFIERIICDSQNQRIGYVIKNGGNDEAVSGHKTTLIIQGQKADEDLVNVILQTGSVKESYFPNYKLTESVVMSVCADYFESVEESSEDNNCLRSECVVKEKEETLPGPKTPPPPSLPDLIVDPYSPFSYDPGRGVFYFTVFNRGQADASFSQAAVYIDGIKVAEKRIAGLKKGTKREEVISYDFSNCTMCQEYRVEIRLDDRNEVIEESELNNGTFKNITCSHLFLPDFDLAVENIRREGLILNPNSGKIKFTLVNRERGTSPTTTVSLFINDSLVESRPLSPLVGGQSRIEYFDYSWQCQGNENKIKVVIVPAIKRVRDCQTGIEMGLGETDYSNNREEVSWGCEFPDLKLECSHSFPSCQISNIGIARAPDSITNIYCYKGGIINLVSSLPTQALSPGQSINLSYQEAFELALENENCDHPSENQIRLEIKADGNDSISELNENNNWNSRTISTLRGNMADLSIERIWMEGKRSVCYEIKNKGTISAKDFCFTTTTQTRIDFQGSCFGANVYREEPDLRGGESRRVCVDVPSGFENWCKAENLLITVVADNLRKCLPYFSPSDNDMATSSFPNSCANGIRDGDEEGIDCGGSCPARCRDCFADANFGNAEDAGYFDLNDSGVRNLAREALQEYVDCLKDETCRITLPTFDPALDFSTITPDQLATDPDYIMEAAAYFVDKNTQYMKDDHDCDVCDKTIYEGCGLCDRQGVISAGDMWLTTLRDGCAKRFCGDCEDHAILREAIMRVLGVSWRCTFAVDHYDSYWGHGHTFNFVFYRSKWRIMDYGRLGEDFNLSNYWDEHIPHNVWNDRVGEYWCPDVISDPACWVCCNTDPYRYTQNYNENGVCALDFRSRDYTYYSSCAP